MMFNQIVNLLSNEWQKRHGLSEKTFNKFIELAEPIKLRKRERLTFNLQGEAYVYFVLQGVVESFTLSIKGKRCVLRFYQFADTLFDHDSMVTGPMMGEPAEVHFNAVTEVRLLRVKLSELQRLSAFYSEVRSMALGVLLSDIDYCKRRMINFTTLSTIENYHIFLEEHPEISQVLTNRKVSEYLGVTEQGLHKVKTKLLKEKSEELNPVLMPQIENSLLNPAESGQSLKLVDITETSS
ncbi:MAG: Crp/Fnr family transcriptional regulator [Bdellovibrionales bacterium]|nr:Crp/Fnr family transcriptional regulator [Bdellovibrionales bacterium]